MKLIHRFLNASTNQNPFPLEHKTVAADALRGDSARYKRGGILLFLDLAERGLHRVLKRPLIFRIMHLKF